MSVARDNNDENFEAAFARISAAETAPDAAAQAATAAEAAKDEPAPAATAEPAASEAAPAEGSAPAEGDAAGSPAAVDGEGNTGEPASGASDDDDALLARFAKLVAKQPQAEKVEPAPAPAQTAPAQTQAEQEVYTEEEKTFLKQYEQDWPDVARADELRRRREYPMIVNHIFQEIAKQLAPTLEAVAALSQTTMLGELRTAVTDYDDVRDKVVEWVDTQPKYLQDGMKHVIQNGTTEEVRRCGGTRTEEDRIAHGHQTSGCVVGSGSV
jgi:hypothetical protein